MSRSGYSDIDNWDLIRWRGAVASAIRGKRGRSFLEEMLAALDALSAPRLIANDLVNDEGDCCAIGSVALARHMAVADIDETEPEDVAAAFGIARALAAEIAFINDEGTWNTETPEQRFVRVRAWVDEQLGAQARRAKRGKKEDD